MLQQIDWSLLGFVSLSMLQEYEAHVHFPRVYYGEKQALYDMADKQAS